MNLRSCLIAFGLSSLSVTGSSGGEPRFEPQTLDPGVEIGYGVAIGDVDGDGKQDILLADKSQYVWYRNGDWQRRVLADHVTLRDNVCLAVADLDGDGPVEIAAGAQWNPGETSDGSQSGSVHFLMRPNKGEGPWRVVTLPHDPTIHRMRWVRDPGGKNHLVVLPLHGIGNKSGAGENGVQVSVYTPPAPDRWEDPSAWTIQVIDRSMHQTHNFDDAGSDLIIGGAEGIVRRALSDAGSGDQRIIRPENSHPPTKGVGEVRLAKAGFIAAIEPMHGTDLVVYEEKVGDPGQWTRTLLTGGMVDGHALAVADLLGTGREQVVAGWRKPDASGKVGIRLYERGADGAWKFHPIDDNTMACEDLKVADLDGDGRPEIIASGRATKNLIVYWNKTPRPE